MNAEKEITFEELFKEEVSDIQPLFDAVEEQGPLAGGKRWTWWRRLKYARESLESMSIHSLASLTDEQLLRIFGYRNHPKAKYLSKCWQAVEIERQKKSCDLQKFLKDFR